MIYTDSVDKCAKQNRKMRFTRLKPQFNTENYGVVFGLGFGAQLVLVSVVRYLCPDWPWYLIVSGGLFSLLLYIIIFNSYFNKAEEIGFLEFEKDALLLLNHRRDPERRIMIREINTILMKRGYSGGKDAQFKPKSRHPLGGSYGLILTVCLNNGEDVLLHVCNSGVHTDHSLYELVMFLNEYIDSAPQQQKDTENAEMLI